MQARANRPNRSAAARSPQVVLAHAVRRLKCVVSPNDEEGYFVRRVMRALDIAVRMQA